MDLIKIYLYANNIDFAKPHETISYKQQKKVILVKDNKKKLLPRTITFTTIIVNFNF